jgi:predicted ATPase
VDREVVTQHGAHLAFTGELPELAVPETLHALIAARLDALPPPERALLTDGSVLGLSFSLPALVAVSGLPESGVERLVDGLVRRELLVLDLDARSPERGQYRFVQGVVREVAYQSIARKNRQARHLAAARHYESIGEDELAGVLASHYLAAYEATPAERRQTPSPRRPASHSVPPPTAQPHCTTFAAPTPTSSRRSS